MTAPQVRSAFFGFPRNSPPSADVTVALTGLTATFTPGTLVPSTALGLSGQTANFTPGALSPNFALPLAGQSATFTGGTLTPNSGGDLTVALTGLTATFTPGTLSPASAVNVIGQSAAFTPGTLLPAPSLALTGQSASFTQGSLGVGLDTALTGQTATFTGGTLTPTGTGDITVALVGLTATFTAGVLIPSGADQATADAGRKRVRAIYRVTIDGQVFECRSYQEALTLLEQAKALAAQQAREAVARTLTENRRVALHPPTIQANTRELRAVISQTRQEIQTLYQAANLDAEIALFMEIQARTEHNEDVLTLLW